MCDVRILAVAWADGNFGQSFFANKKEDSTHLVIFQQPLIFEKEYDCWETTFPTMESTINDLKIKPKHPPVPAVPSSEDDQPPQAWNTRTGEPIY
jgi:hypothetical protein